MRFTPSLQEFKRLSRSGLRVPVAAVLPLESDTRSLFEEARFSTPCVLLESARTHPVTGRYSILAGEPEKILTAFGRGVRITEDGREKVSDTDPFLALEGMLRSGAAAQVPGLPPFVGGAIGVIGFEAARMLERLPARAEDDLRLPDLAFLFFDEAIALDQLEQKLWVIALDRSYARAVERVERLLSRVRPPAAGSGCGTAVRSSPLRGDSLSPSLAPSSLCSEVRARSVGRGRLVPHPLPDRLGTPATGRLEPRNGFFASTHTRAEFEAMVRRAKEFIAAGEIYQANLSQRFSAPLPCAPWELYRRLSEINPSPFAAYADFSGACDEGFQIVSCSPERLLRVRGGMAETRPIAGTRPKGGDAVETAHLRRELLLNEKERAEHLMLVDLERNDLGRVCRYGTVEVDELMALEEYSHVIHIVSNVRGRLRRGVGLRDLLAATFPGGTISGCPKIRCLEVIDALEPMRRHFYTGSLGYVSYTGEMDMNLLIRTAIVSDGLVHVQAGAGIVADSDPAREYEETLHKAQALLEALAVRPQQLEMQAVNA